VSGLLRWSGRGLIGLGALILLLAAFEALTRAAPSIPADAGAIGSDVDGHLAAAEARFDDIRPGAEKRVVWADQPGARTSRSVLYLHGFSASAEEIRPVPDRVAEGLGANLVFWRLTGHGRTGTAMAEASLSDWLRDVGEALAVARAVGDEVIVISTSTGGTLATIAAADPEAGAAIAGLVFVSPNYAVNSPSARLLTWPLARYWVPVVAGRERAFEPRNPGQAAYWTTRYPTVAVLPMAEAVAAAGRIDPASIATPALFLFSDDDQVVKPEATRAVAAAWGGPVTLEVLTMGPADDPFSHVIAGDIMSPGQTDRAVATILDWAAGL